MREVPLSSRPSDFFVSDRLDVEQDCFHLMSARRRAIEGPPSPLSVMSPGEARRLDQYKNKWSECMPCEYQDLVCHVGDEPATGWTTWTGSSGKIPCIRKSGSLFMIPNLERQMTLREMYLCMGYPTHRVCLAYSHLQSLFRVYLPGLSWFSMRKALGNAMVVPQVGCVMGCALASVRRKQPKWAMNLDVDDLLSQQDEL